MLCSFRATLAAKPIFDHFLLRGHLWSNRTKSITGFGFAWKLQKPLRGRRQLRLACGGPNLKSLLFFKAIQQQKVEVDAWGFKAKIDAVDKQQAAQDNPAVAKT